MLDKIRARQAGTLPEEYHRNYGLSVGLDGWLCSFLGVPFAEVEARVAEGGTDEEILAWCCARGGRTPDRMQARIWNEFSRKLGWNDVASRVVERTVREDGLDPTIVTTFEAIDAREGRRRPTAPS